LPNEAQLTFLNKYENNLSLAETKCIGDMKQYQESHNEKENNCERARKTISYCQETIQLNYEYVDQFYKVYPKFYTKFDPLVKKGIKYFESEVDKFKRTSKCEFND
jgi:hypothetical protein